MSPCATVRVDLQLGGDQVRMRLRKDVHRDCVVDEKTCAQGSVYRARRRKDYRGHEYCQVKEQLATKKVEKERDGDLTATTPSGRSIHLPGTSWSPRRINKGVGLPVRLCPSPIHSTSPSSAPTLCAWDIKALCGHPCKEVHAGQVQPDWCAQSGAITDSSFRGGV